MTSAAFDPACDLMDASWFVGESSGYPLCHRHYHMSMALLN